jgi:transposase
MSRPTPKPYSATEKVAILRRHLVEQVPVSDLCEQYQLQPTVFYRWQKQFFENGAAAFTLRREDSPPLEKMVAALEDRLTRKNEALSELMEEHDKLEKELGEG